ncbi:unnamed protein product, partial [Gongylonema pulchrum]|uniref:Reverse transcriptase n=1 Tax=Gongylonema pulchrum TaxID=637853 RepID=A0A183ECE3_9BILA
MRDAPSESMSSFAAKTFITVLLFREKTVTLDSSGEEQFAIKLQSARTMELCLTKWWSNLDEAVLEAEMVFYGILPSPTNMNI